MRLDEWLVSQAEAADLVEARALIMAGRVRAKPSGEVLDKVGMKVAKNFSAFVQSNSRFVGRGGEKLESFLTSIKEHFSPTGKVILDVGSSTGGFTDCLLQHGARGVISVDVGTHQMHEKLRGDPRVQLFEQMDIRELDVTSLRAQPEAITVDVSFISLKQIVPVLLARFSACPLILLFKPQFEVSRYSPKKGGVASEKDSQKALEEMLQFLRELGLNPHMATPSALKGARGNQEYFIFATENSTHQIPTHIFRAYDIRGRAESELSSPTMERIARAFALRVKSQCGDKAVIGVGRDARESSPRIFEAVSRGLQREGAQLQIADLGVIATPMAYFALHHFKLDALLQITASHNPKEDNGLKMMIAGNTLFGEEILSLGREAAALPEATSIVSVRPNRSLFAELTKVYREFLHSQFQFGRKFRLALDCANGMAGAFVREIFQPYTSDLHIFYEEVDCRFPNHEADPTVEENLRDLQNYVCKNSVDVAFAFDGDADRLGVVTKTGRILWGDEILMLLSELVLKERPGATIIGEVKCSEKLFRMIRQKGGAPLMYKTGHSLIKKKMKEVKAPIAGEMSGHLFFSDRYFGFDDAIYGALRVLEVMDRLNVDLDEWISRYPASMVTPEIRLVCEESEKSRLVESARKYFENQKGAELSLIDGVRVGFEDGSWALVRASNTQAVLVLRIEATSLERLKSIQKELEKALGRAIHV